jgi:hypothetical protein
MLKRTARDGIKMIVQQRTRSRADMDGPFRQNSNTPEA